MPVIKHFLIINKRMKILSQKWFFFALITTIFWGIWGAFIELPERAGFPATLGYVVWSIVMIPCSIYALKQVQWQLQCDKKSITLGLIVGFTGAGGQLILFEALRDGPAYIIFPMISLFPVLTIILSLIFLRERGNRIHYLGIVFALTAIYFLSYQPATGENTNSVSWLLMSVAVFVFWGIQAFVMKYATSSVSEESIFFYMALTGVLLAPFAILMTDFSTNVNWGWNGPYLAAAIHALNAVGALTLVYAVRHGKAIIVVPMTGLSPLITVVISLLLYGVIPGAMLTTGVILAVIAIILLSRP